MYFRFKLILINKFKFEIEIIMNNIDLIQLPNQFINSYDNIGSLISFYCRIFLSEKNATECITEIQWLNILRLMHSINNKFKFELKDEEKTKGFLRCSMRGTFLISIIITETGLHKYLI